MLRILLFLLVLIYSCSPKIFPEREVKLRLLEARVENSYSPVFVKLEEIILPDYLSTERILYKEGNSFGYFAKNKWACSPSCMFEKLILKNFKYINEEGEAELKLYLLELYVDFTPKRPNVVLSIRGELQNDGRNKTKLFHYRKESEMDEESIFETFNEVVKSFLKDLNDWISNNL